MQIISYSLARSLHWNVVYLSLVSLNASLTKVNFWTNIFLDKKKITILHFISHPAVAMKSRGNSLTDTRPGKNTAPTNTPRELCLCHSGMVHQQTATPSIMLIIRIQPSKTVIVSSIDMSQSGITFQIDADQMENIASGTNFPFDVINHEPTDEN